MTDGTNLNLARSARVPSSARKGTDLPPTFVGADNDWLRLVIDSMHEGFGLLAPDFTILELNKEAMRIDNRSRDEVIGQSHWVAYPGTEHDAVGGHYKKAMAERIPVELEHRYTWPDGRTSWLEVRAFPVENGCLAVFFRDVTERHLASERLRASEQRFRAAVAAMEGVLWTNNAAGEMAGEQTGWATLTGQSFDEYQGYGWSRAIHPDDVQRTITAWRAAVAAKVPFECEHRVRRADGQWRLCGVRAIPIEDETGAVVEWVGVHRDITDARADELRLHQMAETIDAVFYVHDLDEQRVSYVSRAYESIWGLPRDELYADSRSFLKSVHPDDLPRVEAAMREQKTRGSREIEYRLKRADGSERFIHDRPFDSIEPVSGARRVFGLATDITDYRRAQELVARSAETFANLVVSNPFGIYIVDADFKLAEVSRGARRVFASIDPLTGRDFAEVLTIIWSEPFASEAIARFRHTLETGEPYVSASTVERRADTADVEAYDWRIERIVLPTARYGVVCYFYDLSERNAYEAKLKQALADKDLLTREIDHRVKNSLTIVGSLLRMQRNSSKSKEARAAFDEASDRVLAVARVHERLHKSHQLGVVAFGDYLEQLCRDLAGSMHRPDVEMDCQVDAVDLPAEHAMSFALIANELVTNAFKHACADAGSTKIAVTLKLAHETLILTVSDNGAGLPAGARDKTANLGLRLIDALSRQLRAEADFPSPGAPARISISIPYSEVPQQRQL